MPSNGRRSTRRTRTEVPAQNDPLTTQGQTLEEGAAPAVEAGHEEHQGAGETPTPAVVAEGSGQEEQTGADGQNAAETAVEVQGAGEMPAPAVVAEGAGQEEQTGAGGQTAAGTAVEGQGAAETPAPTGEQQGGLPMTVQIHTGAPVEDVVATADVTLADICTIRNVKIKEDDYGLKVVMPRTKMPDTGRFKDACYFHTPELRAQFDAAVKDAYQQTLQQDQEQGGMNGMTL